MKGQDKIEQRDETTKTNDNPALEQPRSDLRYRLKAAAFLTLIGGLGLLSGFGGAVAAAKKQDPASFDLGLAPSKAGKIYLKGKRSHVKIRRGLGLIYQPSSVQLHESGTILARRALAYGSLWAVFGCSVLFYSIWKLSGAKDLKDFRLKAGAILPRIPRNERAEGRTEFSGPNDLLKYLIDEDEKKRNSKIKRD